MSKPTLNIAVVGAGAAGVFAAIQAAQAHTQVHLFEASQRALAKVKVSGGGRCNICHHVESVAELMVAYPRFSKAMRSAFQQFSYPETWQWFESRGLALKVEEDGRVFPQSNSSQSVIDLLLDEVEKRGVTIHYRHRLKKVSLTDSGYELDFGILSQAFDRVILAMGGQPKLSGYDCLGDLDLEITEPVPSLFTFNVPQSPFKDLQGLSVPKARVQIPGTKWKQEGPLLITHWGFSAYAVLRLSAWQARELAARNYQFPILVNWLQYGEEDFENFVKKMGSEQGRRSIYNASHPDIPKRLWQSLLTLARIDSSRRWQDLNRKESNRLREQLLACPFEVSGKTTFKEEFVTAGGLARKEIDFKDFSIRKYPGLYAVGEFTDVDGITGGYNFQYAWTSGYLAGLAAAK